MEGKKYRIREDISQKFDDNVILYRIEALKDFDDVKKGDIGGWVQKEENLSQEGNCWLYGDATVVQDAMVFDNAKVYGNAEIANNARVYGNAKVFDEAYILDNAEVFDYAEVYGEAWICDNAKIFGKSKISGISRVGGKDILSHTFLFK